MLISLVLAAILFVGEEASANAFVPPPAACAPSFWHRLHNMNAECSDVDDDEDNTNREKARRMLDVRAIQNIFYSSGDSSLANENTASFS